MNIEQIKINTKYLKITRKRGTYAYLCKIERLSMQQGYSEVKVNSLRWNRLQLCIDSIEYHLMDRLNLYFLRI